MTSLPALPTTDRTPLHHSALAALTLSRIHAHRRDVFVSTLNPVNPVEMGRDADRRKIIHLREGSPFDCWLGKQARTPPQSLRPKEEWDTIPRPTNLGPRELGQILSLHLVLGEQAHSALVAQCMAMRMPGFHCQNAPSRKSARERQPLQAAAPCPVSAILRPGRRPASIHRMRRRCH